MSNVSELFAAATRRHRAGEVAQAAEIYRQILDRQPQHADALHLLGVIECQAGRPQLGADLLSRAVALCPNVAAYANNLGEAYRALRQWDQAVAAYRRALQLKPDFPEAHSNLGNALRDRGQLAEATACYRRAIAVKPDYAKAHLNLGNVLSSQGQLSEAIECCRRAVALRPGLAEAHSGLGRVLKDRGRLDEALACYRQALALRPDFAEALANMGNVLVDRGAYTEGCACYRRALQLKPDCAEAHSNLANALMDRGQAAEAIVAYRRALEIRPDFAEAHSNLGNALKNQGRLDEALACYRRALTLKPDYVHAHDNLLNTLQYCQGVTLAQLADAQAEFERQHAAPLRTLWQPHLNHPEPDRVLRLGFVSPDLGYHPVGYFLIQVLQNLDRCALETVCYSDRGNDDALTARLRAAATTWRKTVGVTDDELAEQIRADRIDILFDLTGHTAANRLMVFARKPAPIQITWLGYAATTGLAAMDYILADGHEIPPHFEAFYREKVLRLPNGYVCYDPPAHAPPVAPSPAAANGIVTFGSFNNPAKITPDVVALWSAILRQVPKSRLLLKYRGWADEPTRQRFIALFSAAGLEPDRVELQDWSSHAELLAQYSAIDLALDPFPYSGGLTTCEALWMGVPVITCPGETFASRHSLSHLSNVGLTETIARDFDEYVELAVALASDLPRLAALRAGLRGRMAASPLCDGKRFSANLLALLREIWQKWCRQLKADS